MNCSSLSPSTISIQLQSVYLSVCLSLALSRLTYHRHNHRPASTAASLIENLIQFLAFASDFYLFAAYLHCRPFVALITWPDGGDQDKQQFQQQQQEMINYLFTRLLAGGRDQNTCSEGGAGALIALLAETLIQLHGESLGLQFFARKASKQTARQKLEESGTQEQQQQQLETQRSFCRTSNNTDRL